MHRSLFALVCACAVQSIRGIGCLNEDGDQVDWWFIYKMPNGFSYAYKDSLDRSDTLSPFTDRFLDRIDGALGDTLHQIYVNKKGLAHVSYNDEPPENKQLWDKMMDLLFTKESKSGAHAKGVVASDSRTGFWLVHSVPKFPDLGPPSFTWTADDTYGQTFLCLSLNVPQIRSVATQLQYMHPTIFDSNMPSDLESVIPELSGLINGDRIEGTSVVPIRTSSKVFQSFAKDQNWADDLYDQFVTPTLKTGFYWETWRRGGVLPTICGGKKDHPFDIINVLSMRIGDRDFKYTQDHAKLGISTNSKSPYVCVGDINRMESQRSRGGGTVCFQDASLWKSLHSSVTSADEC